MTAVVVSLLPVLVFLGALVLMDSFKLLSLRAVSMAILAGCVAAVAAAGINVWTLDALTLPTQVLSRYLAPVTEELLKSLPVIYLVRTKRVGFLVDAAILGFAVGAGFALVENVEYLGALGESHVLTWVARGFGTAVLHGGLTCSFAVLARSLVDRWPKAVVAVFFPGWAVAMGIHSLFNHFILPPLVATAVLLVALPLLLVAIFEYSEKEMREWLGTGFDAELEVLRLVTTQAFGQSRIGRYLLSLKSRFEGTVVADMLCLLRIRLELAMRAKGMLMAREAGLAIEVDEAVRASVEEMRFLERSVGATGLLALQPLLNTSSRDIWQFYMLAGSTPGPPARSS